MARHLGHRAERPSGTHRLKARRSAVLLLVTALVAALLTSTLAPAPTPAQAAVSDSFDASFSKQDNGAILLTGNSQMTCATAATGCAAARAGGASNNNNFTMGFIDADNLSTTTNSTSADVSLPAGSTVLYAKLVWGGRQSAGSGGAASFGNLADVKFRTPTSGANYETLTGTKQNVTLTDTANASPYQASIDVTSRVKAAGNGTYWVGDIRGATGADRYAGWSLIVAYSNPGLPLRDLRIYEGFADVTTAAGNSSVDIPINGFLAPLTGDVTAAVGVVAWEGDRGLTGDALKLGSTVLSDASHPATNFFDSAISDSGANINTRNPNYVNGLGVDIAKVNATNAIPNGATQTTLNLITDGDFYYPGIVTTQIDLFTPSFNAVSKTVVNLNGNSPAKAGDTLEYRVTLSNTGDDRAINSIVRDPLPTGVTFLPGSLNLTANPGGGSGPKTDQTGDDQAEYDAGNRVVRVRVGAGATGTSGGALETNTTSSFTFRVTVDRSAAGTTLTNTALLDYRAFTLGTNFTFTGNSTSSPVAALADLALTKTSTPTAQTAGSSLTYNLTATNNGPNPATAARVVDTLPGGTTFVSAAPPAGFACSAAGQVVTCQADTLASGATAVIPITVSVGAGAAAGALNNTATISSTTTDDVLSNNTATASTTITQAADVSLTQSAAPSPTVLAGNNLTYTLTASNNGPSNAANVTVTDPIPVGTTFVSASTTAGTCTAANGTLTCPVGPLAPAAQAVITLIVKVAPDTAVNSIVNTATVSTTTPDPVNTNNTAATTITVARNADLAVVTTANPTTVTAGSVETFTIQVTNNGPSAAAGVVITAPAVTDLTIRTASSTLGSCTITAGAINCPVGALAVGASAIITVRADVAATRAAGPIAYTGSATTTTTDPVAGNNSATATATVTTSADLSLTKSSNPATIVAGSPVTYTLTVANSGPSQAAGGTITDTLPTGLLFVSSASGCTATNGGTSVSCPVGTVAVGSNSTYSFIASTPNGATGDLTNTAIIAGTTSDPNLTNNTASVLSSTSQSADLSLTKTSAPAVPQSGGTITYTLTATNNGPSAATAVSVRDDLPTGITFASGSTAGGAACTAVGAVVTCPVGTLAAGASATVTIVGNIAASTRGGSTNTAVISSAILDPSLGNNTASNFTSIRAVADLKVTLDPVAPSYIAGTEASYTLTVSNLGPGDAQGVVVTGAVPPGLTPVEGSTGGACVVSGGTVTCNLGTVPAGATLPTITLRALVNSGTLPGSVSGSAQIGSTTADSNTANNTDDAVITVTAAAALAITKEALPSPLVAGSTGTYRITVKNNGPSDARDVVVSDTLIAGLTPSTAGSSQGICTITGQAVSCAAGTLTAGASATVLVGVGVSAAATGTIANTATVTTSTGTPPPTSVTLNTPVELQADLQLNQIATPATVSAGGSITYTFTLTNNGPSNAATVLFNNPLPPGVTVLPGGISATGGACVAAGDNASVSCDFGTVAPGTSRTVVISATVTPAAAAGTILTNTGSVTSPTIDPTPADRTATATNEVATVADLAVVVSPVTDPPVAGADQSFVISVSNNGPSNATNVVLRNPLPAGATFVSATSNAGTCVLDGAEVVCTIGSLASGASATVQLTYTLPANIAGSSLTNTATVSSTTPTLSDPVPANNTNSATDIIAAESNLVLTKNVTSGPVVAGSPVTYSFTVKNNGPSDAASVTMEDVLPVGTTLVSALAADGGTCTGTTTVTCVWPRLANGGQSTAQIIVSVPGSTEVGTVITNTATARSDSLNPTTASATATSTVTASADVSTKKTFLSGNPVAGGTVRWQIVVANAGPSQALAVNLTDTAPSGVIFTAATTDTGTCTVTGSGLNCPLGTLASGGTAIITVTGDLSTSLPSGQVLNTAAATSTTPDPNPDNNSGSSTVETTTRANLGITKSGSPNPVTAGTTATWTAVVTNAGPSLATGVRVTEPIPVDLVNYTGTITGGVTCAVDAGSLICNIGTLAPGASTTITFSGTVSPARTTGSVGSTSTVTAATTDPDPTNNSAAAPITIATSADLATTLVGPASMNAGASITWNASISNIGPSNAQAAILTVNLPANGLVNPVVTGPGGACTITGSTAVCALGTLPPGADQAAVSITALIDPGYLGTLVPTVTVSTSTNDPNTGNNQASATTSVQALADLKISKVATQATLTPGQPVGWTITVANSGPSTARNVVVTDQIPTGVTAMTGRIAPDGPDCTVTGSTLSCTIATVVPGQPVLIAVAGTLAAAFGNPTLANTASLISDTPDSNDLDNTVTSSTAVVGSADLSIVQALPSGPPVRGEDFDGRLLITNNGPSDAVTVVVRDVLTTDVLTAAATALSGGGTCTVSAANEVECTFTRIAVGETVEIQITGQFSATAPETLTNAASVSAITSDPNLVNNTTTATVNAESSVDLAIDLTGPPTIVAGNLISWTAVVSNAGPSPATGIVLSAPVPTGVTNYVVTRENDSVCTDVSFCPLADLAAGASTTLTFTATVLPGYTGADIRLGAAVSTSTPEANSANNTDTVITAVTRSADLSVTTTADPKPLVAGENGTYTIVVTNTGPSAAPTTIATDQLPDGVTIRVPGITFDQGGCVLVGRVINCALGIIAPGQSVTITVPFTVSPSFGPGTLINVATATSDVPDANLDNNTGTDSTTVSAYADLTVTKSGPTSVVAGDPFVWSIDVINSGPSLARNVRLTDVLPVGVGEVSFRTTQGDCTLTTDGGTGRTTVDCPLGTVGVGQNARVDIIIDNVLDPSFAQTSISNTATVSSDTAEPLNGPAAPNDGRTNTTTSAVTNSADISITKVPISTVGVPGQDIRWRLTIANAGPSTAAAVVLAEQLPPGVLEGYYRTLSELPVADSDGEPCTPATPCALGNLLPGNINAITIIVGGRLDPTFDGTEITNKASVTSATDGANPGNNDTSSTITVTPRAELSVDLTPNPDTVNAGETIGWDVVITNSGPSVARNVVLTDVLPADVSGGVLEREDGTPVACTGNLVCALGDLAPGTSLTLRITGTLSPTFTATSLSNTVQVSSGTPDTQPNDDTDTATTTVTTSANLTLVKTTTDSPIVAGEIVNWTITVTANGPSVARNVVVTDTLPAGLSAVLLTTDDGDCIDAVCTLGDLAPGTTVTIDVSATIDADTAAGTLVNTAAATSDTTDPTTAGDTPTAPVLVTRSTDLSLIKTISPNPVVPGEPVQFLLTLSSTGPSTAQGVVVTDALPEGIEDAVATTDNGICTITDAVVKCLVQTMRPDTTAEILITGAAAADLATGQLANTASALTSTPDVNPLNNSSSVGTPTAPADLTVTQSGSAPSAVPGQPFTWTIVVGNAGPGPARGVALSDALPTGVNFTTVTTDVGNCAPIAGQALNCNLGTLPNGAQATIRVTGTVAVTASASLTNTASVISPDDNNAANNIAKLDVPVDPAADLAVVKTVTGGGEVAGGRVEWTVVVTNNGPTAANQVLLTDLVPASVTGVSTDLPGCDLAAGCDLGTLTVGQSVTVVISGTIAPDFRGTLTNTAAAMSTTGALPAIPDPVPANNSGTATSTVAGTSDLALTKEITNLPLVAGTNISYLLTASNAGPSVATNTVVSDPVPAGTTAVSATASDGGTCLLGAIITCTWPTLAVSQTRTANIVVALPSGTAANTVISNTATVASNSSDPTPATATIARPVTTSADLSAVKTLLGGDPVAGGTLTWQIVVANDGPSAAEAATLTDAAPAGITFTNSTTSVGSCSTAGSLNCSFGTIANGDSVVVTVTGTVGAAVPAGLIPNTAIADSATVDPDASNDSSTVAVTTSTRADLALTKAAATDPVLAGGPVGWTVAVTNNGPSTATNVVMTEPLPAGVTGYTGAIAGGGNCTSDAGVLTCVIGTLAPGATVSVSLSGTVDPAFPVGIVGGISTVGSGVLDPLLANNTASDPVTVGTATDLRPSIITGLPGVAGQAVSAVIEVTNNGPSVAQNGVLTITVPDGSLLNPVFTGPNGACPYAGGTAVCALGNVAPGSVNVTITGQLNPSYLGALTLTATSSTTTTETNPDNDTATSNTEVTAQADLSVVKTGNSAVFTPGTAIGWTLAVLNEGPSTAVDVHIVDEIPAGLLNPVARVLPDGPLCALVSGEFDCILATLSPNTPVQIGITADLPANYDGATLVNTADIEAATSDPDLTNNSSTATTDTIGEADLRIGKAVVSGAPVAGAAVEYRIEVTNDGPSDARTVVVADDLPADVLNPAVSVTAGIGSCSLVGAAVRCDFDRIADGERVVISITGTLSVNVGADLANTASVSALTADPDLIDNTTTATSTTGQSADLEVILAGPPSVTAGQPISWTATITNNGPSAAIGALLVTAAPAGVTAFTVLVAGVPCADLTACVLGDLAPEDSIVVTFSATVASGFTGSTIPLSATVAATTADPNSINNSASVATAVNQAADLSVATAVSPSPLVAGQPAVYTVTVTNDGPSDAALTNLLDQLPPGLSVQGTVTSTAGTCSVAGTEINCALGTVPADSTVTITIPVIVAANQTPGSITNSPAVGSVTTDPDPTNNTGPLATQVLAFADLTVTSAAPTTALAGETISWSFTVENDGPSVARAVNLTQLLPAGVDISSILTSTGSCEAAGDPLELRCLFDDLAPGADITVTVTAKINPSFTGLSVVTTGILNSVTPEPASSPAAPLDGRSSSVTTAVGRSADVTITKVALTPTAVPGTDLQWQITAVNNGPSSALGIQISDDLPAGLSNIRINRPSSLNCESAELCTLAELLPGANNAVVYTVTGFLDPAYTSTSISNYVRLTSATPDPTPQVDFTSVIPVLARAELSVTMVADPNSAVAGGPVKWLVRITNAGPSTAAAVVLTDLLPDTVTGVRVTNSAGTDPLCTDNVICPLGDLAPQTTITLEITGSLSADYPLAILPNVVRVSSTTPETTTADNTASAPIEITTAADITVTSTGPATIVAGQPISWTITVTAGGPSVSRGVTLSDLLPAGIVGATITTTTGACGSDFICTLGDLAPDATVTITVTGILDPSAPAGQITNTATLTSGTADPVVTDNQANATTVVTRSTDLSVSKTISPDPVVAGSAVTFTLDIQNAGPSSAQGIVLTDALPTGLSNPVVTTGDGDCTISTGAVLTCALEDLAPLGAAQVLVTGTADLPAGELANTAVVITSTPDINPANNSDSVGAPTAPADLSITKTADIDPVLPGGSITWTLTANNAGPGPARSVAITDTLPSSVTVTSVTTSAGDCADVTAGVLVCEVGTLEAESAAVVTVTATVGAGATAALINAASVVSPDDAQPANNVTAVTTEVGAAADLVVGQQLISGGTVAGTRAVWQVDVVNNGPAPAPNSVLTFVLPAGVTGVQIDGADCEIADGLVTCALGTLAVGQRVTVTLSADVDPSYRGPLTLGSSARSGVTDLTPADAAASTTSTVAAEVGLTVTKMATEDEITAGGTVVYVITAGNTGPSTATGVQVLEQLPVGAVVTRAITETGTYSSGVWAVGDLAPGSSADLKLQVVLTGIGDSVNSVRIGSIEVGNTGGPAAQAEVDVLPVAPTPIDPGNPMPTPPQLPMTGFPALGGLSWALWLLAAGLALVMAGRPVLRRGFLPIAPQNR